MKKILIVDDETGVRSIVKRALAGQGYGILEAENGAECIRAAISDKPDLILLDMNMPEMTGTRVIEKLRGHGPTSMIPIIMLTGSGEMTDMVAALGLGADDYMTKPFAPQEIAARVAGVLRRNARALTANPLTSLPGGPSLEEEVNGRIRAEEPFAFTYFDADHFKAYNDVYGYAHGDRVLKALSGLLTEIVYSAGGARSFLGHVGGDVFAAVSAPDCGELIANRVAAAFDLLAPSFYSKQARDDGFITSRDRQGNEQRCPIMTLSIAVVTTEESDLNHYGKVVDLSVAIKRHLKTIVDRKGSLFLKERKRQPWGRL